MPATILAQKTVSVSELKSNPSVVIETGEGGPVAVLNRNTPQFYCIPPELFSEWMEIIEDFELAKIIKQRRGGKTVKVSLDDL